MNIFGTIIKYLERKFITMYLSKNQYRNKDHNLILYTLFVEPENYRLKER